MHKLLSISLLIAMISPAKAGDSLQYQQRKTLIIAGNSAVYAASMTGLYFLWYKDYDLGKFHFHNDNKDWAQIDKLGHAYSCYYEGVAGIAMMKWAGYDHKTSSLIGGSYGFMIQAGVEIFDGFSEGWGASWGDLVANAAGSALVIGQSLAWDDQRIRLKFSSSPSPYAAIRPNLLGSNSVERLLKDYNGQTYWLSVNPAGFFSESRWPSWLNLSLGYGIDGFTGSLHNTFLNADGSLNADYANWPRIRQWYLSPDIDLSKINTDRRSLKIALIVLNSLKFPLPAIEYNTRDGMRGHWIFY